MTVSRPCYCTREDVMRAVDVKFTARMTIQVDQAIEAAAENIDGHMARKFYPEIRTSIYDWPNYQYAYPWRIWFDQNELADVTANPPVVTSGGNVIPSNQIFWGPWNQSPPFTYIELNRALSATFGQNNTPQQDTKVTGTHGYWIKTNAAGNLSAAMTDTTTASCQVTNSASPGVGDLILIDSERMIVADKSMLSTGQTLSGSGCTTLSAADNQLTPNGGTFFVNETLLVDSERMFVVDISGSVLTVKRAWDGTALATHSTGAGISALRQLALAARGDLGTTAATHLNNAPVLTNRIPPLIRSLAIAEAVVQVEEEVGAYAGAQGSPGSIISGLGGSLADKWDEAMTRYARQARSRVI